jgi:hypothetical protein
MRKVGLTKDWYSPEKDVIAFDSLTSVSIASKRQKSSS